MGKVKATKKKASSKGLEEAANDESGILSTMLAMGGLKDDVGLIGDVDDDDEEIIMNESDELDAEPIKRDDILEFIQQLKIRDYRDPSFKKAEKVTKTKPSKSDVVVENDPQRPSTSSETTAKKKDKKTKGNKFKIQHEEISSSTTEVENEGEAASVDTNLSEYRSRKYLLMKTGPDWLEQSFPTDPVKFEPVNERNLHKLRQYAQRLYEDDVALYQERKKTGKSESDWMKTVVSSGTLGDKVAALTVMIQDAAIHALQQLEQMLAMLKKKGKRECFMALDNLKELFLTVWLPDNRKLRGFEEHPLSRLSELSSGNKDSRDRRLLIWYYEDLMKEKYSEFVEALESLAHDQLPAAKAKAITAVYELLVAKPEQEKRLLMVLVNKLGDPDHKVAAKCTHRLITLLEQHPNMKVVVTIEVERLLYRPNVSQKAQYYAVCFLNQMILSHEESELASRLISAYFSFFKSFVKKGEVDSRMMSALLSGVNRAYPYAKDDKAKLEENMNTLYRVVHIVNFNTSIQALMLIYQVMDSSTTVSDRYYTSLYRKMFDPNLAHSSKQAMFLNLLFKTLKKDNSAKRVKAFVKRILQVSSFQSPTFACSTLILVAEVLKAHPGLLDLTQAAEESDDEEHFVDEPEEEGESAPLREKSSSKSSWVHRTNLSGNHDNQEQRYDPHHRNPLYTCADRECIWELKKMARHYHPTVVLFANSILEGKSVEYPGDPLQDFTLIRFLDRFVYRNPKKREETRALQAKTERAPVGARAIRVDTEQYLTQGEAKIPVDEKFFFRYFAQRAKTKASQSRDEASDTESEAGSVDDDEFDEYLSKHEGQFEGDEKDAFDFASEFTKNGKKKKSKKDREEESESESADDLSDGEVDLSDLDLDLDDDEAGSDEDEMGGVDFDEFDDEEATDDDDDDEDDDDDDDDEHSDDEDDIFKHGKKTKLKASTAMKAGGRRGKKDDVSSLFASAEEFSHLLEEGAGDRVDAGGSQAMSNVKDKASAKQLNWEMQRDRWVRDADWRSKKRTRSSSRGRNQPRHKGRKQKR